MNSQMVGSSNPRLESPRILLAGEPGTHSEKRPQLELAYARIRRAVIRAAANDVPPWEITVVPPVDYAVSSTISTFDQWGELIERIVNADALIALQASDDSLRCGIELT